MRKNLKKVFALVLASTCITGVLYGCGDKSKTIDMSENVTIVLSGPQGATDDWQNTNIIEGLQEKFGLTIVCEPLASDSWSTKFSLMLAEDEMPDVVINPGIDMAKISEYGEQGYFLALNEYLDYMPNLKAFFKDNPEFEKYCTSDDGNIYTIPQYNNYKYESMPRVWIRTNWLENVGMEYPTTVDELYDVLVAFRDKDANGNGDPNDELPIAYASSYGRKVEHSILPAFGINAGGGTNSVYYVLDDEDGKVVLEQTTDNYKEYLRFMNKLWDEGLIYNESYSTDISKLRELVSDSRVGVYTDAAGSYFSKTGEVDNRFDLLVGLTSKWNDKPFVGMGPYTGKRGEILVNSATENPERICQMIDFFLSEEGIKTGMYGFEELECVPSVVEGFEEFEIPTKIAPEGYDSFEAYRHKKLVINEGFDFRKYEEPGISYMVEYGPQDKLEALLASEEAANEAWIVRLKLRDGLSYEETFPTLAYSGGIGMERATLKTDIENYIKTTSAQFIIGELDVDKDWDTYISTLNKMGLEKLLDLEQQAYDKLK